MPLEKSASSKSLRENIKEMIAAGHAPKQAVAAALANQRKMKKMAEGGIVEGSEGDLDQEHERNLAELMIQGDQPPIANPAEMDAEMILAKNLHAESEKEEFYAEGGLVEDMSGDEKPEVNHKQDGSDPSLTEAMKAALEMKKKNRKWK